MAKYPIGLLEEELKNKVAVDWFAAYNTTRIIGKVDVKECFQSHFMSDLLAGKGGTRSVASADGTEAVPSNPVNPVNPVQISPAARAVLDAGRELWRYYHAQPHVNPNASYYDIRRHFQGMKTTAKGREQMNPTSTDERYNALLAALRAAMKKLAARIELDHTDGRWRPVLI